jgi:hypothetical protein
MTPEEKLDRLERIAKLMVRAGLRARRQLRQQDDKITIMIDAQIKNEDRFAELAESQNQHDDKITIMIDAQIKNEDRFAELAESQKQLVESQKNTDRRLDALMDIVREGRNGKSGPTK